MDVVYVKKSSILNTEYGLFATHNVDLSKMIKKLVSLSWKSPVDMWIIIIEMTNGKGEK